MKDYRVVHIQITHQLSEKTYEAVTLKQKNHNRKGEDEVRKDGLKPKNVKRD